MIDSENEFFRKAYQEAGRALALYMLCFNLAKGDGSESPTEDLSILLKYCKGFAGLSVNSDRTNWRDVAEFWRATHLILLGGCAAKRIKWKIAETPSLSDTEFEKAYYATQWFWVDLDRNLSDEQIFADTLHGLGEAIEKMEKHWKAVDVLATTLIEEFELSAEQTFRIITENIDTQKLALEREKGLSGKYGYVANIEEVFTPETIKDYERPLGRLLSEIPGHTFLPLKSLEEAKSFEDSVVILQGDDGGQIYVVCQASQVACSEHVLEQLLQDLDEIAWPGNDPDMRRIYYERRPLQAGVPGGMGGGIVSEEPWIHTEFAEHGLVSVIHEVLQTKREQIR